MAVEEDDDAGGIPEWVVTFGDMMSLLLTFFIMLVSMSEMKESERYQALVDSMQKRFGHDASMLSTVPGHLKPRNSILDHLASQGRAKRANTMNGGDKVRAPVGDNPRVESVRSGTNRTFGGKVTFAEDRVELTEKNKQQLQIAAQIISGKAMKIEIRGHSSRKPVAKDSPYLDNWHLAFARCMVVKQFLTQEQGIDARRFRIAVAGPNEPTYVGTDPRSRQENSRVEVVMLDERVEDLEGTEEQRNKRYKEASD